jgi:hypothetical protein
MQDALQHWLAILKKHQKTLTTPRQLYRGQGFLTLSNVMRQFDIKKSYIVTGGQGLIHVDEEIVPYDFTADKHTTPNIWEKVTAEPFQQQAWWGMINEGRNKPRNPVAELINKANGHSEIVISCPKIFLRYISSDILSSDPAKLNAIRILLSASSLGSIPQQLRPYIVAFDRSALNHIPGNRNDATHRAAMLFLSSLEKDPSLKDQPPYIQRGLIFGESEKRERMNSVDVEAILDDRPELLELDADDAYRALYRERGPIGGRLRFKGYFMAKKGQTFEKMEADKEALNALSSLGLSTRRGGQRSEDDQAVKLGLIFAAAVRESLPDAHFEATDFCSWAQAYCGTKKQEVPEVISSPLKTSYFLKTHYPLLGMTIQGKGYRLT